MRLQTRFLYRRKRRRAAASSNYAKELIAWKSKTHKKMATAWPWWRLAATGALEVRTLSWFCLSATTSSCLLTHGELQWGEEEVEEGRLLVPIMQRNLSQWDRQGCCIKKVLQSRDPRGEDTVNPGRASSGWGWRACQIRPLGTKMRFNMQSKLCENFFLKLCQPLIFGSW